jgi:predicted transcriptional regulator
VAKIKIDLVKLNADLRHRREVLGWSWPKIANRIGCSDSVLQQLAVNSGKTNPYAKKDIKASIFIGIIMFLRKPYENYVIVVKEDNNGESD